MVTGIMDMVPYVDDNNKSLFLLKIYDRVTTYGQFNGYSIL